MENFQDLTHLGFELNRVEAILGQLGHIQDYQEHIQDHKALIPIMEVEIQDIQWLVLQPILEIQDTLQPITLDTPVKHRPTILGQIQ